MRGSWLHRQNQTRRLRTALRSLLTSGRDYLTRNNHVYEALAAAASLGLTHGIKLDPAEPEWPLIFIDLPTGQVSWHVPAYPHAWDGHDTPTKEQRVLEYTSAEDMHG